MAHCINHNFASYYDLGPALGSGASSTVWAVTRKADGLTLAAKFIPKRDTFRTLILNEPQRLRETRLINSNLRQIFEDQHQVIFVLDRAEKGDLINFFRCREASYKAEVPVVMKKLMQALHRLHMQGLVHRDIKPENIVFDEENRLHLIDFGICCRRASEDCRRQCGTVGFIAPEIFSGEEYD
jgi:serine/threonine protein kinase